MGVWDFHACELVSSYLPRAVAVRILDVIGVVLVAPVTVSNQPAGCSDAGERGEARTVVARTGPCLGNLSHGSGG